MDLANFVEDLREQLAAAADMGGPESRAVVERLMPGLKAAMRLALLDVLSTAAAEITVELAPGAVELRMRGREPEFVVVTPNYRNDGVPPAPDAPTPPVITDLDSDGATSRLNLRLPEGLKVRIEEAARREGLSLNAWLVRAAAAAVESNPPPRAQRSVSGSETFKGWVQ